MNNESLFTEKVHSVKRAFVLWDGLGLARQGSGIYFHGQQLYRALSKHGIHPKVCFGNSPANSFVRTNDIEVLSRPWYGARLGQLKFVWPQRIDAHWKKKSITTPRIFHGHANINIPWRKGFHKQWKSVVTIHDLIPLLLRESALSLQARVAYEAILPNVHQIVCVSEWTKKILNDRYPVTRDKCVVIPNGFPNFVGRSRNVSSEQVNVLTVSRFESYKKFDDLLKVIEAAPSRYRFRIVTDARGQSWLHSNVSAAARAKMQIFTHLAEVDLNQQFQESDIYLHTSLYEGFGLPIADALAHGLAVVFRSGSAVDEVAGRIGGFPVSGMQGTDEWLVALTNASQAIESPDFSGMLRKDVEQRPSWADAAVQLCTLYANLLTKA